MGIPHVWQIDAILRKQIWFVVGVSSTKGYISDGNLNKMGE